MRDGMDFEREHVRGCLGYSLVPLLGFLNSPAGIFDNQHATAIDSFTALWKLTIRSI